MRVSIVCCTWDSAKYLEQSIRSVLFQDYEDIEYIFVDGGSTDGTLDIIANTGRTVKVIHDVRGGISRAMNEGLKASTGHVIAHLHSDDFYLKPTVVRLAVDALNRSGSSWCYGRIKRLVGEELLPESYNPPVYTAQRLLRGNFIPHPSTFVRRDLMNDLGGFSESLKYAMDYDLWLRLSKIDRPVELNEPLAAFRVHAGSLSSSNRMAALEEDYQVRVSHSLGRPFLRCESAVRYFFRRRRVYAALKEGGGVA